jgi:hypothetical protein
MYISKIFLDVFGKIVGVRGALVALQLLLTIKKGTSPFNFFWSFYAFNKNITRPQGLGA